MQREIALSVFVWDWPENIAEKLALWEQVGVERAFLTFWLDSKHILYFSTVNGEGQLVRLAAR